MWNVKLVGLILLLVLSTSTATFMLTRAVSPSSTFTVSSGIYPSTPTYTVWTENETTYFYKTSTGVTSSSYTDPASLLNSLIGVGSTLSHVTILVKDGLYRPNGSVVIGVDDVTLIFQNVVWRLRVHLLDNPGGSMVTIPYLIHSNQHSGITINLVNSILDFNAVNQVPVGSDAWAGIYLSRCSQVNIPNFNCIGAGSSLCNGWGIVLQGVDTANLGHIEGSDVGSNILEMEGCKHIQVDTVYGHDFALYDDGGSVCEAFSWNIADLDGAIYQSYDITVNSIVADNTGVNKGFGARIAADYGWIHDVTFNQIIATNVGCGGIQIDQIRGSLTDAYNIHIGSVIVENSSGMGIYSKGFSIYADSDYRVHDVTVDSIIVDNIAAIGVYLSHCKNMQIDAFSVRNAGGNGVELYNATQVSIKGTVYNAGRNLTLETSERNGIKIGNTNCSTINAVSVVDTTSQTEWAISETGYDSAGTIQDTFEAGTTDYNVIQVGYLQGWNLTGSWIGPECASGVNIVGPNTRVISKYNTVDSYDYIIKADGPRYVLVNGTSGNAEYYAGNTTWLENQANFVLGSGNGGTIYLRECLHDAGVVLNAKVLVIQQYQSVLTYYTSLGSYSITGDNLGNFYSYLVGVAGSTYYMKNGTTGRIDFSSTNASAVINNARGNLTGTGNPGTILVKAGTYTITSPIILGIATRLIGEGKYATVFDVTAHVDCFSITADYSNWAGWSIENLYIDMNAKNGNGIRAVHAGTNGNIDNVKIIAVSASYAGINLTDNMNGHISNIDMGSISGTGIYIDVNASMGAAYGNSYNEAINIGLDTANAIGLHVVGGVTYGSGGLVTWDRLQVNGDDKTGTIGVKISNAAPLSQCISINNLNVESCAYGVYLDNTTKMTFNNPYIWSTVANSTGFIFVNTTYQVNVFGGQVDVYGWAIEDNYPIVLASVSYMDDPRNLFVGTSLDTYVYNPNTVLLNCYKKDGSGAMSRDLSQFRFVLDANMTNIADHTAFGIYITGLEGESGWITYGKLQYLNSTGYYKNTDCNATATMPAQVFTVHSNVEGDPTIFLLQGVARDDSWSWTPGAILYADWDASEISQVKPNGSGDSVQAIGYALSATVIYFNPSLYFETLP